MEAEAERFWWELQCAKVLSLGTRGQEGGEPISKKQYGIALGFADLRAAFSIQMGCPLSFAGESD